MAKEKEIPFKATWMLLVYWDAVPAYGRTKNQVCQYSCTCHYLDSNHKAKTLPSSSVPLSHFFNHVIQYIEAQYTTASNCIATLLCTDQLLPGSSFNRWHSLPCCLHLSLWTHGLYWKGYHWFHCCTQSLCQSPTKWHKKCTQGGLPQFPRIRMDSPYLPFDRGHHTHTTASSNIW